MKYYLISDNIDTYTGMRLAGIEGVVVHERAEVEETLNRCMADPSIGIVLITEKLKKLCPELVYDIMLHRRNPLLVEIPDRHGFGRDRNSISDYIKNAIGLKI